MRNESEQFEGIWSRILPAISPEHRGLMEERWKSTIDLFRNGEEGVALEILCSNLYEFDITLDRSTFEELRELSLRYRVNEDLLPDLENLVKQ